MINKYKIFLVSFLLLFIADSAAHSERFVPKSDLIRGVIGYIQTKYVNPERIDPKVMFTKALDRVSSNVAPVVIEWSEKEGEMAVNLKVGNQRSSVSFRSIRSLPELEYATQKVARFIKKNVDPEEVKFKDVDYELINGMLGSLDPHSNLFTPENYDEFSTETQGSFGGVGMYIGMKNGQLTVISPIRGTPAARAGLKSKDSIIRISEQSTLNITTEEALNLLRGKAGTPVDIYVMREGFSEEMKFTLIREVIPIVSVESVEYQESKKRLLYINIKRFNKPTFDELNNVLSESDYGLSDFRGFVIDLRDNPGGYLEQAIEIADKFLNKGVIVSTASYEKKSVFDYKAKNYNSIDKVPVVIIVNHGSASASEIFTGALKANGRGGVIGERTFGKGSVQTIFELRGGSALKLTTSQYLTPGRKSIQIVGIAPDVELEPLYVSEDFIRIANPDFAFGEGTYSESIVEWSGEREEALAELGYLYSEPEEIEKEFLNEVQTEELDQDYAFVLAKNVLFNYEGNEDYDTLLANLMDATEKEREVQQEKLVNALAAEGIDWKKLKTPGAETPKLLFKHWVEEKSEADDGSESWTRSNGKLLPSHSYRLALQLTNEAGRPAERVYGLIESENRMFSRKQVVFGNIQSGDNAVRHVPFSVERGVPDLDFTVEMETFVAGEKAKTVSLSLRRASSPGPRFSFEISANKTNPEEGTGRIDFDVKIENIGGGASGDVTVLLKNEEGREIKLLSAREKIKPIEPGGEASLKFSLEVAQKPEDGNVDLLLRVMDGEYFSGNLNQFFSVPVEGKSFAFSNSSPVIRVENPILLTGEDSVDFDVEITDDKAVKDFYAFLNGKKIFYGRTNKPDETEAAFKLPLELSEGVNRLIIVSRDNDNLASRFHHFIRHPKPEVARVTTP